MALSLCSRIEADLSAYLDGELAGPQRAAVEAHLANCGACRRVLADLREVAGWVGGLPRAQAPAALVEELRGLALRRQTERVVGTGRACTTGTLVPGWVIARRFSAAAAAILICVLFGRMTVEPAAPDQMLREQPMRPGIFSNIEATYHNRLEAPESRAVDHDADAVADATSMSAEAAAPERTAARQVEGPNKGEAGVSRRSDSPETAAVGTQFGAAPEQNAGRGAAGLIAQPPLAAALLREPTVELILQSADAAEYRTLRQRVAGLPAQHRWYADADGEYGAMHATPDSWGSRAAAYGESVILAVRPQELRSLVHSIEQAAPSAVQVAWRWDRESAVERQSAPAIAAAAAEESKADALAFEADADDKEVDELRRRLAPPPAPAAAADLPVSRANAENDAARSAEGPRRDRSAGEKRATAGAPLRPADGGESTAAGAPLAPAAKAGASAAPPATLGARMGGGRGFAGGQREEATSRPGAAGGPHGVASAGSPTQSQPSARRPAEDGRAPHPPGADAPASTAVELRSLVPGVAVRMFDDIVGRGLNWLDALEPSVTMRITILPPPQVGPPAPPEALLPAVTVPPASSPINER